MKILFLDLDNTLFPPRQIAFNHVWIFFNFLYRLIPNHSALTNEVVYEDFVQLSLHDLISKYQIDLEKFKSEFKKTDLFKNQIDLTLFEDYTYLKQIRTRKFLITTGLTEFQQYKIKNLKIEDDFEEIVIDDPVFNPIGKKKAFQYLIEKYHPDISNILVIGDNPDSEIKAARELGLACVLIERTPNKYPLFEGSKIASFAELMF